MESTPDSMAVLNQNSNHKVQFSVVIPTFNRADLLSIALNSLLQQTLDAHVFEIIIVDNYSTDETRSVVENLQATCTSHTIHYLFEPRRGGGSARRSGINASQGDWVAFMDDDARASPNWLQNAVTILHCQLDLDGMGGPIYPFYLATKPDWFEDHYETYTWGDTPRFLRKGEAFAGSNMIFRRDLLEKISVSMDGLGMVGNLMSYGEDTVLFERSWLIIEQPKFYYDPKVVVYHATPLHKMRLNYILRRQFSIGASNFHRTGPKRLFPRIGFILHHTASMLRLFFKMVLNRRCYARRENWLVECGGPVAKKLGLLSSALSLQLRFQQRNDATKIPQATQEQP